MHVYKCKMAGSFVAAVHLLLLVALICHETKGVPRRRYGESHESSNTSYSEPYYKKNQGHIHTQRKILSKGSTYAPTSDDTNTRIDGKIIFPSDDDDDDNQHQPFVPNPNPSCENLTFCEHVQNYPNDLVETALRINKDLKLLSGVDLVPDVVHRFNSQPEDSSNSLCDSHEKVVYPKVAQNRDKEWLFIVNQGDFTQGVRVETCKNENNACNVIDGFAEGYKTLCKQKYIYRQLVAVSNVGHVKPEMFRFPASCCCHIKFTGNPYVRIGISANKKSELPTSKARRK